MWKFVFDTCYLFSYLIVGRGARRWYREKKLFDYRRKIQVLRAAYPELDWAHVVMKKGGGSLAFILNNKYVFKVRKYNYDARGLARFRREKEITDALAGVLPVKIPKIDLIKIDKYLFYKSEFIPGKILMDLPLRRIQAAHEKLGRQMGQIIFALFHSDVLPELKVTATNCTADDCGMVHGDTCSNIIVDPKTMDIVGIIDWEFAGYASLWREFYGIFRVRRKMRLTDIAPVAMWEYYRLNNAKGGKKLKK